MYENNIPNSNFFTIDETLHLLKITLKGLRKIINSTDYNISIYNINKYSCLSSKDVGNLLSLQKKFWAENITFDEANNYLTTREIRNLERIPVPLYAKINPTKFVYNKQVILKNYNKKNLNEYIKSTDAKRLLELSRENFYLMTSKYKLESKLYKNEAYYLKEDIFFFKEQQNQIRVHYITYDEGKSKYGRTILDKATKISIPCFARNKTLLPNKANVLFDKNELDTIVSQCALNDLSYNLYSNTLYETFLERLKLKNDFNWFINSPYTKKKWFDFVKISLEKTSGSLRHKENRLRDFITTTIYIQHTLETNNAKEIYSLTTAQINLAMRCLNIQTELILYQFITLINSDITLKLLDSNVSLKPFNLDKIDEPRRKSRSLHEENIDIYDFNVYSEIFNFLINIDYHTSIIYKIDTIKNKIKYISTWLYLLFYLNNALRNTDVCTLPRIPVSDLIIDWNIYGLDWFASNKLTLNQCRQIVTRISEMDIIISKTTMVGHFFCSDDLTPAIGTSLVMLELIRKNKFSKQCLNNEPLLKFYTKYNTPHNNRIQSFFKNIPIENFKFNTTKMTKTVMSFVYDIMNKSDDSHSAFAITQKLRGHSKNISTLQYLHFETDKFDFLSNQLFQRGEFGFIPDTLLSLITNSKLSLEERTERIKNINSHFGNYLKIESTFKLINSFYNEQNDVIDLLLSKSLDETIEILAQVYTNVLPSKESDIQCLFSKTGCRNPKSPCHSCGFAIHSIYALHSLGNTLIDDINLYFSTDNIMEKISSSISIDKKTYIISMAIKKFGKDYVYGCLDIDRNEFIDILSNIDDIDTLYNKLI